jgi:hypothetical protein
LAAGFVEIRTGYFRIRRERGEWALEVANSLSAGRRLARRLIRFAKIFIGSNHCRARCSGASLSALGEGSHGSISMEIMRLTGSVLRGNQQSKIRPSASVSTSLSTRMRRPPPSSIVTILVFLRARGAGSTGSGGGNAVDLNRDKWRQRRS